MHPTIIANPMFFTAACPLLQNSQLTSNIYRVRHGEFIALVSSTPVVVIKEGSRTGGLGGKAIIVKTIEDFGG